MTFAIGSIQLSSPVILSPMAGFSDAPFRRVCRELGNPISISEFIPASAVCNILGKKISRSDDDYEKYGPLLVFNESERPMSFQIFGNHGPTLSEAAKRLQDYGADCVDLNIGCSTKKVSGKECGAALLKNINHMYALLKEMVQSVTIPVTAKIRIGWDDDKKNYLEAAQAVEEAGCSAIAVHGRTKQQAYSGEADWDIIAKIKSILAIPVIGNGDVHTYAQALKKVKTFGTNGVMIGRSARGNPWVFNSKTTALKEKIDTVHKHFLYMCDLYGQRSPILFRKHIGKYLANLGLPLKEQFNQASSIGETLSLIETLYHYSEKVA